MVISHRTCGTMDDHKRFLEEYPAYRKRMEEIEQFTKEYVGRVTGVGLRAGIVRIPVVVHVVYNKDEQNINDKQIKSQIDVLNEDYRMLNADASSIPAVFQPVAADARIEFQLAVRDPKCNPTTGITRTPTDVTEFSSENTDVKFTSLGGHDAWPADKYLNIWVCSFDELGKGTFPATLKADPKIDGVVIDFRAFGRNGNLLPKFNMGRTATHEIGHWLNLKHIWGDEATCDDDDLVDDTPRQEKENYDCPDFPHASCNNDGDMFMNYMDYVDDACMYMFTAGQSARMDAALYEVRTSIVGSDALIPVTPGPADLWSQNTPVDIGSEPDVTSPWMCFSDDIWVRSQKNDGVDYQEHENPEYRPPGSSPNYVYVRIRNKGCSDSGSGNVKLYWAKASTALAWPAPWDGSITSPALMGGLIGTQQIGNIPGGGFVILEFPWYPPNPADYSSFGAEKTHFCLLSRIETSPNPPFGMTYPEGSNLDENVRNNNNIVWKNITIPEVLSDGSRIGYVLVGNVTGRGSLIELTFTAPEERRPERRQESIFSWGSVIVDLGEKLFEKWREGGFVGNGVKAVKNHSIIVTESGASIRNIKFLPFELNTIGVRFFPHGKETEAYNVFFFDITQYAYDAFRSILLFDIRKLLFDIRKRRRLVGGQRFVVKTLPRRE